MYVNNNPSILLWTLQNIASPEHRGGEGYFSCIRSDEQSGVFTRDDVYSFGRGFFIRLRVSLYENRLGPLFRRTSHTHGQSAMRYAGRGLRVLFPIVGTANYNIYIYK